MPRQVKSVRVTHFQSFMPMTHQENITDTDVFSLFLGSYLSKNQINDYVEITFTENKGGFHEKSRLI